MSGLNMVHVWRRPLSSCSCDSVVINGVEGKVLEDGTDSEPGAERPRVRAKTTDCELTPPPRGIGAGGEICLLEGVLVRRSPVGVTWEW